MKKFGFSLMEMMIVLAIVSVVLAASAPMVNQKLTTTEAQDPWVFTNAQNAIAFNLAGDENMPAVIGTTTRPVNNNIVAGSRLHIAIDNGEGPSISFSRGAGAVLTTMGLTVDGNSIYFTNRDVRQWTGDGCVVMGRIARKTAIDATNAIAIGNNARVGGNRGVAIGMNTSATGFNAVAIGGSDGETTATQMNTVAIGANADATAIRSIAIGTSTPASGQDSIAIGTSATASELGAIAIGSDQNNATVATGIDAIAIGANAVAEAGNAISIGTISIASGGNSIAIGADADATQLNTVAIGSGARATARNAVAIGNGVVNTTQNTIRLGDGNTRVVIPGDLTVLGDVRLALNAANNQGTVDNGELTGVLQYFNHASQGFKAVGMSYNISDRRLKDVGEVFTGGLEEIKKLELFNFTFKKDKEKTPQVGVMAQDLQKIFPNSVREGEDGFLRIRWDEMFYAVINAIKELDEKITNHIAEFTSQQKEIKQLKKEFEEIKKENIELKKELAEIKKMIKKMK